MISARQIRTTVLKMLKKQGTNPIRFNDLVVMTMDEFDVPSPEWYVVHAQVEKYIRRSSRNKRGVLKSIIAQPGGLIHKVKP